MNLRKLKNQAGFTLVELIVVIAIMAILAGVAVPVYSGYIEKANKAADLQLLGAVNSAFGAAVIENGAVPQDLSSASVTITDGKVAAVSASAANADLSKVDESFDRYFAGNEESAFNVITALYFDKANGVFAADEVQAYTYTDANGNTITVNVPKSTIEAFNNSTWGTKVTPGQLLGLVGDVTDFASNVDNDTFNDLLTNEDYLAVAADILGVDDYYAGTDAMVDDLMAKWEEQNPNATQAEKNAQMDAFYDQIDTNTAVLVAAKNAQTASTGIMDILASGGAKGIIKTTMETDPAAGLSQAALAYGMYTSYMYSTGKADPTAEAPNPITVLNSLNPDTNENFSDFQEYLDSDQGQKDMEGYLAALNTVGNNSGVASDVVISGFNTSELEGLLNDMLGK